MEAMILAAGEGTRLRPLTERIPKALVEVGGRPLLSRVLERVVGAGARRVVINVHHHQEQIRYWIREQAPPGVEIALSPEPGGPYDTGGGLFAARPLFREPGPFLLHNVDVLSGIPLAGLVREHVAAGGAAVAGTPGAPSGPVAGQGGGPVAAGPEPPIASLAVQEREANRALLFDGQGLMGWENRGSDRAPAGAHRVREPVGRVRRLSFTGIHVVEPRIFELSQRRGTFSIITLYLELAAAGHRILPLDVTARPWVDVGTPERLREAEELVVELG